MGVDLLPVGGPITVVAGLDVVNNGGDPDGVETHSFDVVQVVFDTLEGTAAVLAQVSTGLGAGMVLREPISEELVDRSLLPLLGGASLGGSD